MKWLLLIFCLGVARGQDYRREAMVKMGDSARGQILFNGEKLACFKCHSVDGKASKAGPDLFAVGDKFGRREIIEAVLEPSKSIAVGYSTTTVVTKGGDEVTGIVKAATEDFVELMGGDGRRTRVEARDIQRRSTSEVSLMPEGLAKGLTTAEFTDLIEYLVTLKQLQSAEMLRHGMPSEIPVRTTPIRIEPFISEELKFEHPVWFGPVPGETNAFFVLEHESGTVWRLAENKKTVFAELGKYQKGTRGLLGIVFHPRFARNGRFFYAKHIVEDGKFTTLILEGHAGQEPRLVLRVPQTSNVHYGGGLEFGPDGYLYIGQGDSGPQEDPNGNAQNTMLFTGKIMRIDVDHAGAGEPYSVPEDNPFVGRAGMRPEIWAYGFREPWRFSFDPLTQDFWVGDVGQDRYEEVDIVRKGENHGWNIYEGFERFSNQYRREGAHYVQPVFAYARKYGPSVTGGFVYRANTNSPFYGQYIFGDYESKRIFALNQTNRTLKSIQQIAVAPQRIASFGRDAAGELYVVGYEGMIYRLHLSEPFDAVYFGGATNSPEFAEGLKALPKFEIEMDAEDLFGAERGIYRHPLESGEEWERPAKIAFEGSAIDCGIRIQGGWNRRPEESPKHAFRLIFRKKYGAGKWHHALFDGEEPQAFDELILRAGCNNTWLHWSGEERKRGDYMRDQWMRDSYREMGHASARGAFVHLFLNGRYWGIYNLVERPGAEFAAAHFGGRANQFDARNGENILSGDTNAWSKLFEAANGGRYAEAASLLDIPAFADFMILNFYGANADWDRASNWYAARRRSAESKFVFFVWDGERTLENVDDNSMAADDDQSPTRLFHKLIQHEEFKRVFSDRARMHLSGVGALSPKVAAARYEKMVKKLDAAIVCEAVRWGAYRHDVHQYKTGPFEVYTRDEYWRPEVERLRNFYFPRRSEVALKQMLDAAR